MYVCVYWETSHFHSYAQSVERWKKKERQCQLLCTFLFQSQTNPVRPSNLYWVGRRQMMFIFPLNYHPWQIRCSKYRQPWRSPLRIWVLHLGSRAGNQRVSLTLPWLLAATGPRCQFSEGSVSCGARQRPTTTQNQIFQCHDLRLLSASLSDDPYLRHWMTYSLYGESYRAWVDACYASSLPFASAASHQRRGWSNSFILTNCNM